MRKLDCESWRMLWKARREIEEVVEDGQREAWKGGILYWVWACMRCRMIWKKEDVRGEGERPQCPQCLNRVRKMWGERKEAKGYLVHHLQA